MTPTPASFTAPPPKAVPAQVNGVVDVGEIVPADGFAASMFVIGAMVAARAPKHRMMNIEALNRPRFLWIAILEVTTLFISGSFTVKRHPPESVDENVRIIRR
jgi:hypothetical protein